jgi:hypothetical protein
VCIDHQSLRCAGHGALACNAASSTRPTASSSCAPDTPSRRVDWLVELTGALIAVSSTTMSRSRSRRNWRSAARRGSASRGQWMQHQGTAPLGRSVPRSLMQRPHSDRGGVKIDAAGVGAIRRVARRSRRVFNLDARVARPGRKMRMRTAHVMLLCKKIHHLAASSRRRVAARLAADLASNSVQNGLAPDFPCTSCLTSFSF